MKRREFLFSAVGLVGFTRSGIASERPCPPSSFNVSGGSSVSSTCDAEAAVGDLPRYMSGLSDFQVRNLDGDFGPRNRMRSLWDALPAEWRLLGQPHGADGIFTSWSGGRGDPGGRRLFVHGGGHGDSSNNGLYIYDFSGDEEPGGWSVAPNSLSPRALVASSSSVYSDSKPTSIHSYDQQWYDPNQRRFYRFSGSPHTAGSGTRFAYFYDVANSRWNSDPDGQAFVDDANLASLGSTLIGSPDGSCLLYLAATKVPRFVTVATGAVKPFGRPLSGSEESQFASAIDSARSDQNLGKCRYVALFNNGANGPRIKVVSVDWSAQTWSVSTEALTGDAAPDLNSQGACIFYDELRDSFWAFANRAATETGVVNAMYEIDAESFTVRKWPLDTSSAVIKSKSGCKGGFNRHVWFPQWRIAATVHKHDAPVSLIKLPGA